MNTLQGVVGDFGFGLEIPRSMNNNYCLTSSWYRRLFPSELMAGKISPVCDVYSCGVVSVFLYSTIYNLIIGDIYSTGTIF